MDRMALEDEAVAATGKFLISSVCFFFNLVLAIGRIELTQLTDCCYIIMCASLQPAG